MLKKCVGSLLNQTFPAEKYEIIIVDGPSTDGTADYVKSLLNRKSPKIRYLKVNLKNLSVVRNMGIEAANGQIIGFTDDDCIVSDNWIEIAVNQFRNDEKISGIMGKTVPEHTIIRKTPFEIYHTREFTDLESYATCNIFYKKSVLLEIEGFDKRFSFGREDTDLAMVLKEKGHFIVFNHELIVYHSVIKKSILEYLKSMKNYEIQALFLKKHPYFYQGLYFGFLYPRHIYLLFFYSYLIFLSVGIRLEILIILCILFYFRYYVFIDFQLKKYPFRFIRSTFHIIPDILRLYYSMKGSIKYKRLII